MADAQQMLNRELAQNTQVNKAIEDSDPIRCECGSIAFVEARIIKKIPGLYVGSTTDQLVPVPCFVCAKCGEILPELAKNEKFAKMAKLGDKEPKTTIIQ